VPGVTPDHARQSVAEALRKPVKTTWRQRAGAVSLEVRCPPTGEVEVLLRGAGGAPLADRPVQAADQDPPAPLALDIPEPGRPLTLQVIDRAGRPAAEWPIGLVRPEGPLASLWPASLRTGPDGTLTLPGLEAGRHAILVGQEKERREVVIPAADGAEVEPAVERIVVSRAAP
jgi:hypothetical protein